VLALDVVAQDRARRERSSTALDLHQHT
jgi:hypothetical protein